MPRKSSWDGWYPPPSRPRPVEGGIRAKSSRGPIGETWWSRRFIELLESLRIGGRMDRGRTYARQGQVISMHIDPGAVTAAVQGSRARPYRVRIGLARLSEADWRLAEAAMVSRAAFLARLLAGEMPEDIEEAFGDCSHGLFPATARELDSSCSCPDWVDPCKHVAAAYYLLAEAFDDDPFLLLRWRGREREELLGNLRALRGSAPTTRVAADDVDPWEAIETVDVPSLADRIDVFWHAGPAVTTLQLAPTAPHVPDAAIRALDDLDRDVSGHRIVDVLEPAYATITSQASRQLRGAT
jgi:uncharacterized Zn finger protein